MNLSNTGSEPPFPSEDQPSPAQRPAEPRRVSVRFQQQTPVFAYLILGLTIFVYLLQMASASLLGGDLPALYLMKINQAIRQGEFWRLITPLLLHGSIAHILFNMYALYAIGRRMEIWFGSLRFVLLYLVSGFAGNVLSFLLSPNPSLGASTAIFGLVTAEAVFFYANRDLFAEQARSMLSNSLFVIAINLFLGFTSAGIDNWGHLGGLAGGLLFAWFAGPRLQVGAVETGLIFLDQRTTPRAWLVFLTETALFAALVLISLLTG